MHAYVSRCTLPTVVLSFVLCTVYYGFRSVERLFRLSEDPPFYEDNPMFSHQLGEPCSRFAWTTWDSYDECEEEYVRFLDCGRDNRSLHDCASPDYNISFTRNSQYIGTGLCDILPHESLLYNQLSFPNDDVQPTILSAHAHGYPVTDHVIAHLLMYPRSYIQHWRDVEEM
ncbi:hypothetical protein DPMN_023033 [Dreissena polymorpha]|uniref:Uncharacterized protein n=1 Tax=Dreissena polymorpha TaxID=45954 RepID=A0A9D4LM93_DREPO|nr:hypothetical protein DPMN_023033 [Dreissena polymorpha]